MPVLAPALYAAGYVSAAGFAAGSGALVSLLGSVALSYAATALARAKTPDVDTGEVGQVIESTTAGGTRPQTILFGQRAVSGNAVAPAMSHGIAGTKAKGRHRYLTYVLDVGDAPQTSIDAVIFEGEKVTFSGLSFRSEEHYLGATAVGDMSDVMWMTSTRDGTQTVADTFLRAIYDDYPTRPWESDMVLEGVPYAVLNFRSDPKRYRGEPRVQLVAKGVKLYDPRKDSTNGGSGAHRFGTPSTWEFTRNPAVMIYNILRGFTMPDGQMWGVGASATELPVSNWSAAMNVCDEDVSGRPRYQCDLEIEVAQEPLAVISEMAKTFGGDFVNDAGYWYITAGEPDAATLAITDADILFSRPMDSDLIPGFGARHNGGLATYFDEANGYNERPTAIYRNSDWLAEDGGDERLVDLDLRAVTSEKQAVTLVREAVADSRRRRAFTIAVRRDLTMLRPLQTLAWTSDRYGFTNKLFEVRLRTVDWETLTPVYALRERDPDDFDPDAFDSTTTPLASPAPVIFDAEGVDGFNVTGQNVTLSSGRVVAGALVEWVADPAEPGSIVVEFQDRNTTTTVAQFTLADSLADTGAQVTSGLTFGSEYRARAKDADDPAALWTSWVNFDTPDAPTAIEQDLAALYNLAGVGVWTVVDGVSDPTLVPAPSSTFDKNFLLLTATAKSYIWNGSSWTSLAGSGSTSVDDLVGTLSPSKILEIFAAESFVASRVFVTDLTNMVRDPEFFEDEVLWTPGGEAIVGRAAGSASETAEWVWRFQTGTSGAANSFIADVVSAPFIVEEGTPLALGATLRTFLSAAGTIQARVAWYEEDGTTSTGADTIIGERDGGIGTAEVVVNTRVMPPSGTRRGVFRYRALRDGSGDFTGNFYGYKPWVRRAVNAQLIVDGGIEAVDILASNSVTAALMSAGVIITAKAQMGSATIGTAQIESLAVERLKVGDGAVSTTRSYEPSAITAVAPSAGTVLNTFSSFTTLDIGDHYIVITGSMRMNTIDDSTSSVKVALEYNAAGAGWVRRFTSPLYDQDDEGDILDFTAVVEVAGNVSFQFRLVVADESSLDEFELNEIYILINEETGK